VRVIKNSGAERPRRESNQSFRMSPQATAYPAGVQLRKIGRQVPEPNEKRRFLSNVKLNN